MGIYTYYLPFVANAANGFTSQITIQNIGEATHVGLQYFDAQGHDFGLQAVNDACSNLAAKATCTAANPFAAGTKGTGVLTSSQPLAVLVSQSTPFGGSAYTVAAGAGQNLVAPLAINNVGGFVTQLNLTNVGPTATNAIVIFYDQQGNALPAATRTLNLDAHTSQTLDQSARDSGLPNGFYGWARIAGVSIDGAMSHNDAMLVAQVLETRADIGFVALVSSRQLSVSSNQSNDNQVLQTSTENCMLKTDYCPLYAPAIFNDAFGGFSTGANIVNPNNNAVEVTITYYNADGTAYPTTPFDLAAHAIAPIYHGAKNGAGLPTGGLPAGFYGSATVSISGAMSDNMVMAVNEAAPATQNGSSRSGTYLATAISKAGPSLSRIGLPIIANNPTGFMTGVTVLNAGTQPAQVTLTYLDNMGNSVGTPQTKTLATNASFPFYQGDAAQGLPLGFVGTALITGDQPLLVTTNTLNISNKLFFTYTKP